MPFNVYVTGRIAEVGLEMLREAKVAVEVNPEERTLSREELLEAVRGRDGVICLLTDTIDREVLAAAKGCRIFANYAVGYDNIDVPEATRRGIIITNTPGVLTDATADLSWALLFCVARRIVEGDRFVRSGKFKGWSPSLLVGREIKGKTLGLVGAGRIGTAVGLRSAGFGMKVLYTDSRRNEELERKVQAKQVPLQQLLRESDFVSIHLPLDNSTRHIIAEKELRLMKKEAFLINTSRGAVLDEAALVEALREGRIAGAALDVYEEEPKINPGLIELENVVLAPHLGSATTEARRKMAAMVAENILATFEGKTPPNIVNPGAIERAAAHRLA